MEVCGAGKCASCKKKLPLSTIGKANLCAQCKQVAYCNKVCQTKHWFEGGHKQTCPVLSARYVDRIVVEPPKMVTLSFLNSHTNSLSAFNVMFGGKYKWMADNYNRQKLYRKVTDTEIWLRMSTNGMWQICSSEDKDANSSSGVAHSTHKNVLSMDGKWMVWSGKSYSENIVTATHTTEVSSSMAGGCGDGGGDGSNQPHISEEQRQKNAEWRRTFREDLAAATRPATASASETTSLDLTPASAPALAPDHGDAAGPDSDNVEVVGGAAASQSDRRRMKPIPIEIRIKCLKLSSQAVERASERALIKVRSLFLCFGLPAVPFLPSFRLD